MVMQFKIMKDGCMETFVFPGKRNNFKPLSETKQYKSYNINPRMHCFLNICSIHVFSHTTFRVFFHTFMLSFPQAPAINVCERAIKPDSIPQAPILLPISVHPLLEQYPHTPTHNPFTIFHHN